jgi:hypothetical protein
VKVGARDTPACSGSASPAASRPITGGVIWFGAGALARGYTTDSAVAAAATSLLAIVALYHVVDAVQAVMAQVLRGYKRATAPMVIYAVALVGRRASAAATCSALTDAFGPARGAAGFWIAAVASLSAGRGGRDRLLPADIASDHADAGRHHEIARALAQGHPDRMQGSQGRRSQPAAAHSASPITGAQASSRAGAPWRRRVSMRRIAVSPRRPPGYRFA